MQLDLRISCLVLLLMSAGSFAWGHGKEGHQESGEMKSHMEQMIQVKEKIPEEYQVMNRTPVTPDERSLAKGAELYRKFCATCHGEEGRGDGPAAQAQNPRPADFLDLKHSGIYGPGEKFWIIGHGSGATGMPGFEKQLSPRERWDLVNHLYQLQEPKNKSAIRADRSSRGGRKTRTAARPPTPRN